MRAGYLELVIERQALKGEGCVVWKVSATQAEMPMRTSGKELLSCSLHMTMKLPELR